LHPQVTIMNIEKVKDPQGITHHHNGRSLDLAGTFFCLSMSMGEYKQLPKVVRKRLTTAGHWTQAYELDRPDGTARFYLRNKARWRFLDWAVSTSRLTFGNFLGFLAVSTRMEAKFTGETAFVLIGLLFSRCLNKDRWRYGGGSYAISRDMRGKVTVTIPSDQYAYLIGPSQANYQLVIERLLEIGLDVQISHL
jgi:hypothetical protein